MRILVYLKEVHTWFTLVKFDIKCSYINLIEITVIVTFILILEKYLSPESGFSIYKQCVVLDASSSVSPYPYEIILYQIYVCIHLSNILTH